MYEVGKSILNLMLLISTVWIIYRVLGTFFEKRKWTVLSWISWGASYHLSGFCGISGSAGFRHLDADNHDLSGYAGFHHLLPEGWNQETVDCGFFVFILVCNRNICVYLHKDAENGCQKYI